MQEELAVAQLASPLVYSIFPENFPNPPLLSIHRTLYNALSDTSSHIRLHMYVLPISSYALLSVYCLISIGAGFRRGNRNYDQDNPSCSDSEKGQVCP